MTGASLFDLFQEAARSAGDAPALTRPGRVCSFSELHEAVIAQAHQLSGLTRPGPIAILTHDGVAFLAGFFACAAVGRAAMPLDPAQAPESLTSLFSMHPPAAIIAPQALPKRLEGLRRLVMTAGAIFNDQPLPEGDGCAEFYWGLTSGTTGEPKLFARSHASWIASFDAAEAVFAFPARSRVLIPGPLHHSLFLYGAVHALCRGHTVLLPQGQFRRNRLAEALLQATHLYAVPFMLAEIIKTGPPAPNLRVIFSGGSKLPQDARRAVERAWPDADLVEFYGASETSFITFHSTRNPASDGSVGRPFPGVNIEICDAGRRFLPPGQHGEIFVSSPMLFSRYVGEEPAGRWFSVGDTGYFDELGCLHLAGRTNRMIKSRGLKIHPEAIEAALLELPEIRRAAVIGLPDARRGAVAVAAVEFANGAVLPRKRLSAHCRAALGLRACPRGYFAFDELPLTRTGKVAVAVVRQALIEGGASFRELR